MMAQLGKLGFEGTPDVSSHVPEWARQPASPRLESSSSMRTRLSDLYSDHLCGLEDDDDDEIDYYVDEQRAINVAVQHWLDSGRDYETDSGFFFHRDISVSPDGVADNVEVMTRISDIFRLPGQFGGKQKARIIPNSHLTAVNHPQDDDGDFEAIVDEVSET